MSDMHPIPREQVFDLVTSSGDAPGTSTTDEEEDADGEAIEPLTKVYSHDIQSQIDGCTTKEDEYELQTWYNDCIGMVRDIIGIAAELERLTRQAEEADLSEPLSPDISITSFAPTEDPDAQHTLHYIAFGADFDGGAPHQDIFIDCDLVAEKILDKKRIQGVPMYKVQWRGTEGQLPSVSWHPFEELECRNLILKFEAARHPPSKHEQTQSQLKVKPKRKRPPAGAAPSSSPSCGAARNSGPPVVPVKDGDPPCKYAHPNSTARTRLFHGTRSDFAAAIIQDGFRLPEQRSGHGLGPVRPHMFGKGIYFTSNLEKACHFGDTVLVCEVLTGNQRVMRGADYAVTQKTLQTAGYDSIYAPPGCGGNVFDEYVVYHPGQVRVVGYIRY